VELRYRVRLAVNILNGSTLFGVLVAVVGRARLARGPEGLLLGSGYRLRVPVAPAFCVGNVILARDHESLASGRLLVHEARHATQYAWCAGLVMLPFYFIAAGASWALTGDFAARNLFERGAGLADGGYADSDLRPAFARFTRKAAAEQRKAA
jgi:hypothetical protein